MVEPIEMIFLLLAQGCQNFLIHRPLYRIFAFSSTPDKFNKILNHFLNFRRRAAIGVYINQTKLTFTLCYTTPLATLTRKKTFFTVIMSKTNSKVMDETWKLIQGNLCRDKNIRHPKFRKIKAYGIERLIQAQFEYM